MSNVKLAPIRMSEIKATDTPVVTARYAPPSKRVALEPIVTSLDFNSAAFPSLYDTPVVRSPTVGGFKQKILDLIAKEALDEAERNRVIEDPKLMTKQQLLNTGWASLPLGNIKEAGLRFNEKFYQELA